MLTDRRDTQDTQSHVAQQTGPDRMEGWVVGAGFHKTTTMGENPEFGMAGATIPGVGGILCLGKPASANSGATEPVPFL